MLMMLRVIPIIWQAVRPSRVKDMPAVVNTFWLRKGYEGLTFFGTILTPTQAEADRFNSGFSALKNHEMIHLRQAQSTGDSWLRFYLLYIWYWLKGLRLHPKIKSAAYLLNPFELEAYGRMHDQHYLDQCKDGATEWRRFAKLSLEERLCLYKSMYNHSS